MPYYQNGITKPDEGTKHVQRRIIDHKNKRFVCELRMKPSGLGIRKVRAGYWYTIALEDLMQWMSDPKNPSRRITKS